MRGHLTQEVGVGRRFLEPPLQELDDGRDTDSIKGCSPAVPHAWKRKKPIPTSQVSRSNTLSDVNPEMRSEKAMRGQGLNRFRKFCPRQKFSALVFVCLPEVTNKLLFHLWMASFTPALHPTVLETTILVFGVLAASFRCATVCRIRNAQSLRTADIQSRRSVGLQARLGDHALRDWTNDLLDHQTALEK